MPIKKERKDAALCTHTTLIKAEPVLQTDVRELVILEWNHRD